jgi:hypothetical protein
MGLKKTGIYRPDARGEMNLYVGIAMLIMALKVSCLHLHQGSERRPREET